MQKWLEKQFIEMLENQNLPVQWNLSWDTTAISNYLSVFQDCRLYIAKT